MQDIKNGKELPWREKKINSVEYADIIKDIGNESKAERVYSCGHILTFRLNPETDEKRLIGANFCRERLCPMCAWRRSIKCYNQVKRIIDYIETDSPNLTPLLLTLTVRNCEDKDLNDTIDNIFKGWHRLTRARKVARAIKGWFRAFEITHNRKEDTFHPHLHIILLVDKQYFTSKDYIDIKEWVKLWRRSARLDYNPICDIRKIDTSNSKDKSGAIAEVAKYTIKDSDYLVKNKKTAKRLVLVLSKALRRRRLLSFGGIMKTVAKKLKLDDIADGDLINTNSIEEIDAAGEIIVWYHWNHKLQEYILYDTSATVVSIVSSKGRDPP